jgi:hypothetical protein
MVVLARGGGTPALAWLLRAGLYVPTILFCLTKRPQEVAFLFIGLMVAALIVILLSEWAPSGRFSSSSEEDGRFTRHSRFNPRDSTITTLPEGSQS